MIALLAWAFYACWLGLFAWFAWRAHIRLLVIAGALMLLGFAAVFAKVQHDMAAPDYSNSVDMGSGMMVLAAAFMLVAPLIVAAVAYPFGRLWAR